MYTIAAINDIHTRAHISLSKLLKHCESLTGDEFTQVVEGFGIPSVQQQLQHVIDAERYWRGVLNGQMLFDENAPDEESIATLEAYRVREFESTQKYLKATNDDALNAPATYTTWGDKEAELTPARVIIRTQTHIFQHLGQVAVMCRIVGKPIPRGMDFLITELPSN